MRFAVRVAWSGAQPTIVAGAGVECQRPREIVDGRYRSGVYLPSGRWSDLPPPLESSAEISQASVVAGDTIVVTRLPDSVRQRFYARSMDIFEQAPIEAYEQSLNDGPAEAAAQEIEAAFREQLGGEVSLDHPVIAVAYAYLFDESTPCQRGSTTRDLAGVDELRGLHVDNWEQPLLPLSARARARAKLLVNLGLETRSFVFAPYTVEQLWTRAVAQLEDPGREAIHDGGHATALCEWFMHHHPDLPIFRLDMEPGTAVIAPVQNIIHDGHPHAKTEVDVCFHARVTVEHSERMMP